MLSLLRLFLCIVAVSSFVPTPIGSARFNTQIMAEGEESGFNPMKSMSNMMSVVDDVIDDFFYKRMGNGEIFYGKRKINPSGNVEGQYNGMGLTDKQRIDDTRELKELRMAQKRQREAEK